ncbi:MAG: YqgE/AlgH family protein [Flavobacteriaceae bacterium]
MDIGSLLIATPSIIGDPNFQRSVVLLVDKKETGTVGFILNKKSDYTLNEVMENISLEFPLYFGGPVEQDNLFFVHSADDLIPNSLPIGDQLFWSGDFDVVIELLQRGALNEKEIRFFLGYSGWSEQQLESEIDQKSWVVVDPNGESEWFKNPTSDLWKNHMKTMGGKYLIWSNAPENPSWN